MRTIKFRAWDKKDQMMYHDVQKGIEFDDGSYYAFSSFLGLGNKDDYHEWEIMQFTGLTDKNGVEVYEGDILNHPLLGYVDNQNLKVIYRNVGFKLENGDNIGQGCIFEVIGNIYENSELLK